MWGMRKGKKEIGYAVKHAQQALHSAIDEALRGKNLTMSQYVVLFNLTSHPGASSAELARMSFVTPQTMIRLVKALESSGLVVRRESTQSSRILKAQVTSKGKVAVHSAEAEVEAVYSQMLAGFEDKEIDLVTSSLNKMTRHLQERRLASEATK